MNRFPLEIVTPQRLAYREDVDEVSVPTPNGTIGILAHHVPLFTVLSEGEIKVTIGPKEYFVAIGGGFMEVTPSHVSILVSRALHADELNEAEIKKAHAAAREAIAKRVKGMELREAQSLLRRSFVELKVLRRMEKRRQPTPLA